MEQDLEQEQEKVQSIDWNDPDIPIQFFALRREVIRLNLIVDALVKSESKAVSLKEVNKPGSKLRAKAWKEILKRHRLAIAPQDS